MDWSSDISLDSQGFRSSSTSNDMVLVQLFFPDINSYGLSPYLTSTLRKLILGELPPILRIRAERSLVGERAIQFPTYWLWSIAYGGGLLE